jgi:hypothetical protein
MEYDGGNDDHVSLHLSLCETVHNMNQVSDFVSMLYVCLIDSNISSLNSYLFFFLNDLFK